MKYVCPRCRKNTGLSVTAKVAVKLSFDAAGEPEGGEPVEGGHDWADDSPMWCACGKVGAAFDFRPGPRPGG